LDFNLGIKPFLKRIIPMLKGKATTVNKWTERRERGNGPLVSVHWVQGAVCPQVLLAPNAKELIGSYKVQL
jgi:hypothetical protein